VTTYQPLWEDVGATASTTAQTEQTLEISTEVTDATSPIDQWLATSRWTREDLELGMQAAYLLLFALLAYEALNKE
jgi:hypothetical protein